jgi:hypothetical protein
MENLSTYHLIYELLSDGKGKLYPEFEPIDKDHIMQVLISRYSIKFSKCQEVAEWFIDSVEFPASERASIETMLRIKKAEWKALKELKRGMGSE